MLVHKTKIIKKKREIQQQTNKITSNTLYFVLNASLAWIDVLNDYIFKLVILYNTDTNAIAYLREHAILAA